MAKQKSRYRRSEIDGFFRCFCQDVELQCTKLSSQQLKFRLYHLRNTDQNAPYYNIPDSDSYIYVVFEQETGYMVSNCAKLQWELTIARGVSDFDIEHRTIRFLEYQASISHLNLKEY